MRKIVSVRFFAVVLVLAAAVSTAPFIVMPAGAAQEALTLDGVLRQLDRAAGSFRSLSADLERTKVTVVVNDKSTETGQIQVRHDGKMRIEFTAPDPETILRDGDRLYLYKPKIGQVEEYDLGKHRSLVDQFLLLGFGTSGQDLKQSYDISLGGEETLGGVKVVRLELTPRTNDVRNEISKIELWIDESNWLPAQQQFYETGTGDYFIVRYTHIVRNPNLADSLFKPHWPGGTTKVKPQS